MPTNTHHHHHRPFGSAYLRGKPVSEWISALSKRRPATEPAAPADPRA